MAIQNAILKHALIHFLFILAILAENAFTQNCMDTSCPGLKQCCSRWGSRGTGEDYCGFFCFSGPCNIKGKYYGYDYNVEAGPGGKIESIITPALFDSIMSKVESNCSAKGFYNYKAFITAFKSFGAYKGKVAKREIAAIFAHFSYGSKAYFNSDERYPTQLSQRQYH
ncbi:BnaC03g24330D [Brassica napus]|uniref:BnaC03g24330D protein n=1 Tax=Brassica napus TaxID=3708 RepID=A0A078I324_BRANA|nr:BnaC03g24330D [Brassica napus]